MKRTSRHRLRPGAVLLEVIIAMTIFVIASAAALARAAQARHVLALAYASENRLGSASAFLDHVVLWPREDLERRLGTHIQGPWMLDIERPVAQLYSIAVLDSTSKQALVNTVVYRAVPVAPNAQ